MSEYEFGEVEQKRINYYVHIFNKCIDGVTMIHNPSLFSQDDIMVSAILIFHAVTRLYVKEDLNKLAFEAMEYLRDKQKEAEKSAEEARESLKSTLTGAVFEPEDENIADIRAVINSVLDLLTTVAKAKREKESKAVSD